MSNTPVWPPGPWDLEPKEGSAWVDIETGIQCETNRHRTLGHWCGYIIVPDREWLAPFGGEWGYDIPGAHGRITYSNETKEGFYKVGFDCAHAWDNTPTKTFSDGEYRTLAYVKECIAIMARAIYAERLIHETLAGV